MDLIIVMLFVACLFCQAFRNLFWIVVVALLLLI